MSVACYCRKNGSGSDRRRSPGTLSNARGKSDAWEQLVAWRQILEIAYAQVEALEKIWEIVDSSRGVSPPLLHAHQASTSSIT